MVSGGILFVICKSTQLMLLFSSKMYVYQCINCNACMHKVHALVNFLLILACNDLMHLEIWTCVGDNQIEPYKMEKLKFWDKPYKTGKEGVEKEVLHPGIVPHFETRTVNKFWACVSSHSKLLHAILNCKPVHTDHNLNIFPLRSVLVLGYKY